jgi:hypothetical protein
METKLTKPAIINGALTPASLHKRFITVTHLVSVLGPSILLALRTLALAGPSSPLEHFGIFLLGALIYSVFVFLYYLLAGGMEKQKVAYYKNSVILEVLCTH